MMYLEGKVAIVTGGGRGIGRAIALDFAENGADVVVAARTSTEIKSVAAKIKEMGRQSLAIPTDMTKEVDILNLVNQTYDKFGKIDVLVNNAGTAAPSFVIDMKTEDWDQVINVNLRGVFIATREVLKKMKLQKQGCIISISSGFGIEGQPTASAYGASKAGVILFSDALSKELSWVKVYVLNPGLIDTKLAEKSPGKKESPEIISPIIVYLASDECKLPSGTVVKRLQLDNLKAAVLPLIRGKKFLDRKALLQEITPKLSEKILRNVKKYKHMFPFLFDEYIE